MDEITDILATEYGTAYEIMSSPENDKIKGDDEVVTLPVLKSKTWTNSKDKFIFKLQGVKGKIRFTLEYVIDNNDISVTSTVF